MSKDKVEHGDLGSSFGVVVAVVTQGARGPPSTEDDAAAEDEAADDCPRRGRAKAVVIAVCSDDGRFYSFVEETSHPNGLSLLNSLSV